MDATSLIDVTMFAWTCGKSEILVQIFCSVSVLCLHCPAGKGGEIMLVFLIGVWKTSVFTLVWLSERWVPLSLRMWGLTYCVKVALLQSCPSLYHADYTHGGSSLSCFPQVLCHRHAHTRACSQNMTILYIRDKIQKADRKFRSEVGDQREVLVWVQERYLNWHMLIDI